MKKLELKDIIGYFPYGLEIQWDDEGKLIREVIVLITKNGIAGDYDFSCCLDELSRYDAKIILRPMSDLTKPIVVNGKEFVQIVEMAKIIMGLGEKNRLGVDLKRDWSIDDIYLLMCCNGDNYNIVRILDLLNQWHFDYRDLIGQGLAIDINTLKK